MKRDKDLIRQIVLDLRAGKEVVYVDGAIENYHIDLLMEAKWVTFHEYSKAGDYRTYSGLRLTWLGAEVADILSQEDKWNEVKATGMIDCSFDIIIDCMRRVSTSSGRCKQ